MYVVAIFIDGGYVHKVLKHELGGVNLNFEKLAQTITKTIHPDAQALRSYFYHCPPYKSAQPTQEESQRFAGMEEFLAAIDRLPRYCVRRGRLARYGPNRDGRYFYRQKMVDVNLSIDLVHTSLKGKITHAAIVAGDSDFIPAIQMAKNESVSVWLFHGKRLNSSLRDIVDERIQLTEDFVRDILWEDKQDQASK